jgi:DNA ligase-1
MTTSPKASPKKKAAVSPKKEKAEPVEAKPAVSSLFSNMKKAGLANGPVATTFLPDKDRFHPVKDACWDKGQPVPYAALAQTFYAMEKTSKRIELLSIVTNYFRAVLALTPKDLVPSMYLLTNKVAPDYDNIELGIGDTVLFKALAEATGSTVPKLKAEFHTKGDIGLVAEANRCNQKLIFTPKKLNVAGVFNKLKEIAQISGNSVCL